MSLKNIQSLIVEDQIIQLPHVYSFAKQNKKTITFIGFNSSILEDNTYITEISMLHVNTQNQSQWTNDLIKVEQFNININHKSWSYGWSQGLKHIFENHLIVLLSSQELTIISNQFKDPLKVNNIIFIKDLFNQKYPMRSNNFQDICSYFQLNLDITYQLKTKVLALSRIFDKLIGEKSNTEIVKVQDKKEVSNIELLKKHVLSCSQLANNSIDFFERIKSVYPHLKIVIKNKKIIGYNIALNEEVFKGSEIDPRLSWSNIIQDRRWIISEDDLNQLKSTLSDSIQS